ncbi:MAG: GNAT family N-acetyltransferase [Lachnospiraceae bacterium]|nr:GNAT family N-acetyltransferase [Lachnospiraceae bacterium]
MLDLVRIIPENAPAFMPLIKENAYLYVMDEAAISVGITEDGMPIAALLFQVLDDGNCEILSICVDSEHRRQGFATELLVKAADFLAEETECSRFICRYDVRDDAEDSFTGFLEYLGFTITRLPGGCFVTTIGELKQVRELEGGAAGCVSFAKLTTMQKKQLREASETLAELMDEEMSEEAGEESVRETIEENLSCVIYDDKTIRSYVIFTTDPEDPEALSVAWAETSGTPADMLFLMRHAMHAAAAYPDDKKIYIPVVNERSERLVEKLLGDHAKRIEKYYEAQLDLYSEESEEAGESA